MLASTINFILPQGKDFFYFFIFLPEQFSVIQESIRIQVQSAVVARVMSDLLIKAAGTTPGCKARPGWLNLHLPACFSEDRHLWRSHLQGEDHSAKYFSLCDFIQPTVRDDETEVQRSTQGYAASTGTASIFVS